MTTTTNVEKVVLNIMTQAQYTSATKDPTALYAITDATIITVDQTYNPSSANAQSGVAIAGAGFQTTSNLVTSVSSASTDTQYPSAKLFYDTCGDIETLINAL